MLTRTTKIIVVDHDEAELTIGFEPNMLKPEFLKEALENEYLIIWNYKGMMRRIPDVVLMDALLRFRESRKLKSIFSRSSDSRRGYTMRWSQTVSYPLVYNLSFIEDKSST